jgi:cell wall-associated NlpC family hydrolase
MPHTCADCRGRASSRPRLDNAPGAGYGPSFDYPRVTDGLRGRGLGAAAVLRRVDRLVMALAVAGGIAAAGPSSALAARYGSRTLRVGTHGGDVSQLQRLLTGAGHRTRRDGAFGPRTARALRMTERELELRADGVASRREQRAIRRSVGDPTTGGGAVFVAPPPPTRVKPGVVGAVTDEGLAVAPRAAPRAVKRVIAAGNEIARAPYKWGGGHGRWRDDGYDCSGSVSFALHGAGLLDASLTSGDLARWGERGAGRWITIYANRDHVYMVVAGLRFDTSAQSRAGSRWSAAPRASDGFSATHPAGL